MNEVQGEEKKGGWVVYESVPGNELSFKNSRQTLLRVRKQQETEKDISAKLVLEVKKG